MTATPPAAAPGDPQTQAVSQPVAGPSGTASSTASATTTATTTAPGPADPIASLTWRGITPLGHAKALGLLASGPMAVLAGFALASAITLGSDPELELLDTAAISLLCLSATTLLWGLHLVAEADGIHASPSDYVEWYPELRHKDYPNRDGLRARQREEFAAYYWYRRRGLNTYHVGSSLALTGLTCFLCARIDGSEIDPGWDHDTFADAGLGFAALASTAVVVFILSYMPAAQAFVPPWNKSASAVKARNLGEFRWDRAVQHGARYLVKTPGLDEDARVAALKAVDTPKFDGLSDLS